MRPFSSHWTISDAFNVYKLKSNFQVYEGECRNVLRILYKLTSTITGRQAPNRRRRVYPHTTATKLFANIHIQPESSQY